MKTSSEMPPPHHAPAADRPSPGGAPRTSMRIIWIDLLLYPTHSLPTAAAPVLVGLGLAYRDGVLAPLPALVGFLRRHPGLGEHPELDHAIADGTLSLWMVKAAIAGWLLLALLAAPWLWRIGGAPVLAAGAVG